MYKKEWARDVRYRKKLRNLELVSRIRRYVLSNAPVRLGYKHSYKLRLISKRKMNRYGYSQVVRRCILSGRAHGLVSDFGLSRHKFKQLVEKGLLSGITKSSW